jgi:UDP-3-O-[3-hydroxymyristoyl] N-acetylglucosamine deacetylase
MDFQVACELIGEAFKMRQTTISKPVTVKGVGLHTGVDVRLTARPAPENTGYVFVRTDLENFEIPASVEYISHCSYATTLIRRGVVLSTCEHLLSALRGLGIDNCFIDLDNIEVPILDGSSEAWIELLTNAGRKELDAERKTLKVLQMVDFEEQGRSMSVEPSDNFEIECVIDFPHPFINRQSFHFVMENGSYERQIAAARTFGFEREIETLRNANLALGGSLDNAIVLTEDGMLNEQPLRYDDEFVRHKILDIIGDVALLGMPLQGKIKAERSGHAIHAALMSKLLKTADAWEIV